MSEHNQNNPGSFLGGFTIGLFAGAAGYFLFGTDKGSETRKSLEKEWQGAKKYLAQEGIIPNEKTSFKEMLYEWLDLGKNPSSKAKKTTKTKKTKAAKSSSSKTATKKSTSNSEKTPAKKTKKFKGV